MARVSSSSKRTTSLPVAEPLYPPPNKRPHAVQRYAVAGLAVAAVVAFGAYLLRPAAGRRPTRAVTPSRETAAAAPTVNTAPLAERVAAMRQIALQGPQAEAWVSRYETIALLDRPVGTSAERPTLRHPDLTARILGVERVAIPTSLSRGTNRELLLVAYAPAAAGALPVTRGAEAAQAYAEADYAAYPADAVVLVCWSSGPSEQRARVHAVDFVGDADVGVAVAAVEIPADDDSERAVAFALGDPVSGSGRLISEWMTFADEQSA